MKGREGACPGSYGVAVAYAFHDGVNHPQAGQCRVCDGWFGFNGSRLAGHHPGEGRDVVERAYRIMRGADARALTWAYRTVEKRTRGEPLDRAEAEYWRVIQLDPSARSVVRWLLGPLGMRRWL